MAAETERVVLIGDRVAGTLTRASGEQRFTYDEDYRSDPDATPLSVSMPTRIRTHTDSVITPWLWGLLPDNDKVLAAWGRQFKVSVANPFGLLATPLGEDCAGAVRIVAPERVDALTRGASGSRAGDLRTGIHAGGDADGDDVEWLTEDQVADRLRDLATNSTAWLGARRTGRFSLAGAQPKTALLMRDGSWGDPHGRSATTHILKPAITGFDDHDLNEHLCLAAMRAAGLRAVRTRVVRFGDASAIVVARYDRRTGPGGKIIRLHQEDMAQALGVHPSAKYQNEGGPSPESIAALLRRVMLPSDARGDVENFTRALIWNWIIAGPDAHAKNYSILLAGPQVVLAPFYDVASALPYRDMSLHKLKLAMNFGSGYKVNPVSPPWPRLARDVGMREPRVRELAAGLLDAAVPAFEKAVGDPEVRAIGSTLPDRLLELVTDRVVVCRKLL